MLLTLIDQLNVWTRGTERAVNQPLLLLYALGRWSRGDHGDFPYVEVEDRLSQLPQEFGPPRQVLHPEYPFCHLPGAIWTVHAPAELRIGRSPCCTPLNSTGAGVRTLDGRRRQPLAIARDGEDVGADLVVQHPVQAVRPNPVLERGGQPGQPAAVWGAPPGDVRLDAQPP